MTPSERETALQNAEAAKSDLTLWLDKNFTHGMLRYFDTLPELEETHES